MTHKQEQGEITRRKEIREIKIKGKTFKFDLTNYDGTSGILLALLCCIAEVNEPKLNKILTEFKIRVIDSENNALDFNPTE